ncbi:redoxin domain-containing protein [Aeromicrobium sp. UC242_57]|uniref:redoxin domain-containing protein n=1 Tax=Aeromicrobium sp. UC242_57 TaxID=3374624 RepID=UPI0037AD1A88
MARTSRCPPTAATRLSSWCSSPSHLAESAPEKLAALRDSRDEFSSRDAEIIAVSCDSFFANRVFSDRENLGFAVLSDFWPHGEVARSYGTFNEEIGVPDRGTFVIDREGILRWMVGSGLNVSRDSKAYLAALSGLA